MRTMASLAAELAWRSAEVLLDGSRQMRLVGEAGLGGYPSERSVRVDHFVQGGIRAQAGSVLRHGAAKHTPELPAQVCGVDAGRVGEFVETKGLGALAADHFFSLGEPAAGATPAFDGRAERVDETGNGFFRAEHCQGV